MCQAVTHKREDLDKGFEPDECYYIQNWKTVAGLREIDFAKDPPPDLIIEVEVSRTVLSRLPIISAFKIPEVWRYDGERVTVLLRQPDGSYRESTTSRAVPTFPFSEVGKYLALVETSGEGIVSVTRQFRTWIRSQSSKPKS